MNLTRTAFRSSAATHPAQSQKGDLLLLSMRRLAKLVAYCILYEFEDVAMDVADADCVEVGDEGPLELSRRAYKLARIARAPPQMARALAPRPATVTLRREYDLFLPMFNHTYELYALAAVPDWRQRCRYGACYLNEVWPHLLPGYLLELLEPFDHIFIGTRHCVEQVAAIVHKPCSYLPLGADVLSFAPWPEPPERSIDVCNIGRRSPVTHGALLELARSRQIFYYYDTVAASGANGRQRTFQIDDHREHRLLLAQLLQRSRHFISHRARINEPEYTGNVHEIPGRYFEGAAAGAVMLGEAPATSEFRRLFDWQDAVIPVPFDCPDIGTVVSRLDADPRRLIDISRRNVHFSAQRHDWVHRLQSVFDTLGMEPTAAMHERKQHLQALADLFRQTPQVSRQPELHRIR